VSDKDDRAADRTAETTGAGPEAAAAALLEEWNASRPADLPADSRNLTPIPVEEIATAMLGLRIEQTDELRSVPNAPADAGQLSGLLITSTRTIWIDSAEARRSPQRRRFTIAHELGHWVIHARRGKKKTFQRFCRPVDLERKLGPEAEANAFAAALLLPSELLREQAEACRFNLPLLATRFDVSLPALRLRLTTLDLLPAWMR
jgi:IrrE N-terminal-like domain